MTDAQIQTTIDACKAAGADPTKVEWNDLKAVLTNILTQVTLTDLGTPTSGHVPKFIGGVWTTGPDQTADAGTGADIDTTLSIGDTTERQIVWDKTIAPPTVEGAAVNHRVIQHKSLTKAHPSGVYQSSNFNWWHSGTKQGTTVNEVMMFGWNIGAGGGPDVAGPPGIGESWESNYTPGADRFVEKHEYYITPASFTMLPGTQIRLSSYTINTATGGIDYYKTVGRFYIKLPYATAVDNAYFLVQGDAHGAQLNLNRYDGGSGTTLSHSDDNGFSIAGYGWTGAGGFLITGFNSVAFNGISAYTGFTRFSKDLHAFDPAVTVGSDNYPFRGIAWKEMAGFPSAGDLPHGFYQLWHNTSTGETRLYVNRYGTLKYVTLT